VADQVPAWVSESALAISVIVAIPAVAKFIYDISKDRGPDTKRSRVLEQAKTRTEFWKARLEIQTKTFSGKELERAKETANDAIERIYREADENLVMLSWIHRPLPVIGVSRWRKLLLLYKPGEEGISAWRITRVMYWASLVPFIVCLWLPVLVVHQYLSQPDKHAELWQELFYSRELHRTELKLLIVFRPFVYWAITFFRWDRMGRKWRSIKETDRM